MRAAVLALLLLATPSAQDVGTSEELAAALLAAATDEDRARLLETHSQLVTSEAVAGALNTLGVRFGMAGNYAKALESLQKSLVIYEKLGNEERSLDQQINIGNVFRWQRDFDQALSAQGRVLAIAEKRQDKRRIAIPNINIGFILQEQGNLPGALEHFEKGLALMRELGDQANVALTMTSIASVQSTMGKRAEAIVAYKEAFQIQEALGNKAGAAFALGSLAYVEASEGRLREAIVSGTRALTLAQEVGARETIWRVSSTLGDNYATVAEYADARAAYERAIETIEGMRKELVGGELEQQRFFSDKLTPYWGMLAVALKESRPVEALAHAERAKARMLLDVARSGRSPVTQAMTADERDEEARLRAAVAAANSSFRQAASSRQRQPERLRELSELRDRALLEYERFETVLYASHPELKIKRGEAEWAGPDVTARLIPRDGAIIEFAVTDDRTYGFVLTRNRDGEPEVRAWTIEISSRDLATRTENLRRRLEARDLGFRKLARDMYDALLRPAAPHLAGKNTLIIVPDRMLWELPFQALDAGGRYVLEDHVVLYANSIAVLNATSNAPRPTAARARILAIGDASLPHATREAQTLRRIYGIQQSTTWIGPDATESRFKKEGPDYSVVHFATHGVRDDQNPMRSHLVLTQPQSKDADDGVLEAWEFMQMDLKADLLVLSACETALGKVGAGEGMIGLTWALFIAGSPTIVATQWRVESSSTTDLIIGFHRDLVTGASNVPSSLGAARSLRTSALRLLKSADYAHPFYWAGFVAIGARL